MAVISENEIQLNSIRYPLTGKVQPVLSSHFADKMVVGDYSKASNPEVDSWVIQDQRGGILAEEMDEARQADRAYWSTCNLGFLGHIVLPPKPTAATVNNGMPTVVNGDLNDWSSATDCDNWTETVTAPNDNYSTVTREDTTKKEGTYGAKLRAIVGAAGSAHGHFTQPLANYAALRGKTVTFGFWARWAESAAGHTIDLRFTIDDGVSAVTTYDIDAGMAKDTWTWVNQSHAVSATATKLEIEFYFQDTYTVQPNYTDIFVDNISVIDNTATPIDFINFNSNLYYGAGNALFKFNKTTYEFDVHKVFPEAVSITALVSDGSYLYIYAGDTNYYWYMDTSDVLLITDEANATKGIYWDSKLIKVNAAGLLAYATASPADDGTDWTTADTLPLTSGYLKTLFLYRDAAGEYTIYAATRTGLFAFDWTTKLWVETELTLPDHPTCGMGAIHWREKAYVSAGLDTLAYQVGGAGTAIVSVGLDRDDGLPKLRGGEIVKFIPGFNEFFALVDSTYEGATSRSTVMAYDGWGWQCWWESGSDNVHMYSGIVSSVYAYRLWFGAGASIYWIALQRNLRNPKKVTDFNYHTAGVHITPWFDANWVGTKLALQFKVFCKDTTAAEDVVVDYRIDHATTAIGDNGWTNLGTIETAGDGVETTYTFGDSLGTNFKAIQFRFTLASGTATLSPDIQYAVLEYQKIIKPTWGWAFTIDCTNAYAGRTADQMLDAVVTAAELEVLTPFLYKDTTYYVRVKSVEGERLTGDGRKGTYNVLVLKPI